MRFIDAVVDGLDLAGAGFVRIEAKATGRPGYAPDDLLKLYIYGYLNLVRSSRRQERESPAQYRGYLAGGLELDFKTIADFRRDSRGAFKSVSASSCCCAGGSTTTVASCSRSTEPASKAVNNKHRDFTRSSLRAFIRAADERLEDYLRRLNEGDVADGATSGGARTKNLTEKIAAFSETRRRYNAVLSQLGRTGEDRISLTDPDSRAMAAPTKVAVG